MNSDTKKRLRRVVVIAAIAGALCHLLPVEYRSVCTACVKLAALPFGGL